MKQFRSGINPNNDFAFHFTTMKGGQGITDNGKIYTSSIFSVNGAGVYAGTTPTPSWALKHIPWSGWGLGKAPVRIPIKIKDNMDYVKPMIPVKTIKFKGDVKF